MTITKEMMINYLQSQMDDFNDNLNKFGLKDDFVQDKLDAMIACKEMVESLIGEPVNLRRDGKVTVGF